MLRYLEFRPEGETTCQPRASPLEPSVDPRPSPVGAKQVHSTRDPMTSARMRIVPLIQSLKSSKIPSPRAMPWAILLRPFRASVRSALLQDEPFFARPAVNREKQQRACFGT